MKSFTYTAERDEMIHSMTVGGFRITVANPVPLMSGQQLLFEIDDNEKRAMVWKIIDANAGVEEWCRND